ncbi:MAG TPA: hypothetical protein VG388_09180 [Solirubrobacteraceae bacterium]|nr:hypothetical protein [Solirubrobacteraceae bacterium]
MAVDHLDLVVSSLEHSLVFYRGRVRAAPSLTSAPSGFAPKALR